MRRTIAPAGQPEVTCFLFGEPKQTWSLYAENMFARDGMIRST
jgi:hypothetical protein